MLEDGKGVAGFAFMLTFGVVMGVRWERQACCGKRDIAVKVEGEEDEDMLR